MPKIEGSPFISKKRQSNGLNLKSKADFTGQPAILKPNTREQRRQLDNILDNKEYSLVPLSKKTSLTDNSLNSTRMKKPAQNCVIFD